VDLSELPTRRSSLTGTDLDGNKLTLAFAIARKLYRCPGCRESVNVGAEHVVVARKDVTGEGYHQHWHRDCARTLVRTLKAARSIPA
jgi:hypothetical protein